MNDFTDLFYTLFSIVIFSFLLLQANSLILRNESAVLEHEFEKMGIAQAQSIIEEAKAKPFDSNNTVDEFSINPWNGTPRRQIPTFDGYDGYEETVQTDHGSYDIIVTVTFVTDENSSPPFEFSSDNTASKRMTVQVTGPTEMDPRTVTLSYIKSYFQN